MGKDGMRRPRGRSAALWVCLALLAQAVAAPAWAQDASSMPAEAGVGTRLEVASAGVAVTLPGEWLTIDLGADPGAAAFSADRPELAGLVADLLATGPMNALAISAAGPDDPLPAVFALFTGPSMGMTAEAMLGFTLSALPQMPGVSGEATTETLELAGLPGFRVAYAWALPRSDGTTTSTWVEQVTVIGPSQLWVFSVTDDAPPDGGWAGIAGSLELLS